MLSFVQECNYYYLFSYVSLHVKIYLAPTIKFGDNGVVITKKRQTFF